MKASAGKKLKSTTKKASKASAPKAKQPKQETGYSDLVSQSVAFDTTGTIVLASTIAQGTAVTQRVGKRIILKNVQVKGTFQNNAAATYTFCELALVYDKRPTGSLPNINDIFDSFTSYAFAKDTGSPRFTILRRWSYCLAGAPATGNGLGTAACIDDFVKIKDKPVVYKAAATGAIADIEEGALYLVSLGGNAAGTSAASGTFSLRVRFVDV